MVDQKAEKGNFKHMWLIVAFLLAAVLLAFVYAGFSVWQEYQQTIINNQKEQMLLTAQSISDNLEVLIQEYQADMKGLWAIAQSRDEEEGTRLWDVFLEYSKSHDRYIYDVLLEDSQGEILKSAMGYKVTHTFSVSAIDDDISLYQCRLDNGEMYLIMKMRLEGKKAISLVIDAKAYYQNLISGIRLGTNGYVMIKDSRGTILMHPEDMQWGIDVIRGRQRLYPDKDLRSLEAMIEKQNRGEEGVEEYYSYWWSTPGAPRVKKISAYVPARIGEDFLVVSAVIDYDDIYIPVAEGFLKLSMVFAGILGVIVLLGMYVYNLLNQRRKDTEQIAYLTELNRLLEEMHQSEETIAHQQRLQIMGTMTGGIAHEFNNLLTPIMGYADLLMLELPEDSEGFENASEIYEASVKAKEIIQQISSLSRKNLETAFKNLDIRRVLQRALKMVQSVCPANVHLKSVLSSENEWILGNETQINQVILNICVNAIHAIGHQEGTIQVKSAVVGPQELEQFSLSSVPDNWEKYIRIDIEDDGCGMSDDVLKQIFDPFFTTKKGGKGTGLGLALVEQIVNSHKGCIFAESVPGKGSIFHLYLPVSVRGEALEEEKIQGKEGLNLLLVDDNPKVLKLLERNFTKHNIGVSTAMNFEEARRLLQGQRFDAVAAEQYIGGKSAVDFCMSIQGLYPGLVKIVMADRVTKELAEARYRRIIDAYIDKPASDDAIVRAVKDTGQEL